MFCVFGLGEQSEWAGTYWGMREIQYVAFEEVNAIEIRKCMQGNVTLSRLNAIWAPHFDIFWSIRLWLCEEPHFPDSIAKVTSGDNIRGLDAGGCVMAQAVLL